MKTMVNVLDMAELPTEEMLFILRQGAVLRLSHLEGRLLQAKEHVRGFEAEYGTTLDALRSQGLPDDADYKAHEDFIEWEYWHDRLNETNTIVGNVKILLEKTEEQGVLR